jgi:hypothetical protein
LFRKNTQHLQPSFFDSQQLMSVKMRQRLQKSWAQTFREVVLKHIPEGIFAVLFSDIDSRPNAPINIIVGGDILKSGLGWTDEELEEHLGFDLLTRHALGLDDLSQEAPTLRTVYNLRRRVREHAEQTGVNLYAEVFAHITDEQLARLELKTGWQRMDSTQLLSNIARMNRLELVIAVLQKGVKGLPEAQQAVWQQAEERYLSKPAQNVCYRLKTADTESHLLHVGGLLLRLQSELVGSRSDELLIALVQRTLAEQYEIIEDDKVVLRAVSEMDGGSLQSPYDPEATYREKNGESYKGYVTNLSETCDPANPVQLITSVQTASNKTDDGQLLAASLDDLAERGIEVNQATVDGGYNGPTAEAACTQHQVSLRPTTIRGGQGSPDRFGWEKYEWTWDKEDQPDTVTCPGGQTAALQPGAKSPWWLARMDRAKCAECPFFDKECRVKAYKQKPPTLHVKLRSMQVACLRQGMSANNYAIRANVESTVHAFKRPFAAGKLPVRGVVRAHMMACGSALMVNLRRLHHYFHKNETIQVPDISVSFQSASFWQFVVTFSARLSRRKAIVPAEGDAALEYPAVMAI